MHRILYAVFLFSSLSSYAQPKGSSSKKPWKAGIGEQQRKWYDSTIDGGKIYKALYKHYHSDRKSSYEFGDWEFQCREKTYYDITGRTANIKEPKAIPRLLGIPSSIAHWIGFRNAFHFEATDPDNNKFKGQFVFNDSLFETYDERDFSNKRENYRLHMFVKTAEGLMISGRDTAVFRLTLDYENKDTLLNLSSFMRMRDKTIIVKPIMDNALDDPVRSAFQGYDFLQNDIPVAGIYIGKGFMNSQEYQFWIKPDNEPEIKHALATMLYIVASLF